MSNLWSRTYDYAVAVTKSDTVADPAGPFAGLLCSVAGTLSLVNYGGGGATVTLTVVAGQELHWPVTRVNSTGTTATMIGLVGAIIKQGPV